jgi:hypothetical protein
MKKLIIVPAVLAAVITCIVPAFPGASGLPGASGIAHAQDDWKKEFEELCAKTQDSAEIPSDELKKLVDRCDRLKPRIEKLDETQQKVYLRRLQMCRDLYVFVLDSREKK